MKDENNKPVWRRGYASPGKEHSPVPTQPSVADAWLDDALKKYGNVEPRPGLEGRILANLHAAEKSPVLWPRLRWAAVALVALACGTVLITQKRAPKAPATVVGRPSSAGVRASAQGQAVPSAKLPETTKNPAGKRPRHPPLASLGPRREQFPTPVPLSEQEEMLVRYVRERRQEATMVARARAELLKQELAEFGWQTPLPEKTDDVNQ